MNRHDEKLMRLHWESEASDYVFGRRWSAADARVLEVLHPDDGDYLLEIGFGSGLVAAEITKIYPNVTYFGVDFADRFIQAASEILPESTPLILADAADLPFKDESFHHILEMDAIHHFPRDVILGVVKKLAGLLVPGGQFIAVEDWAAPPENERDKLAYSIQKRRHHTSTGMEYHPSENEWIDMFQSVGLSVENVERVERPLNFGRFEELKDPATQKELAELRRLWGDEPATTKMTLFICKKG